MTLPTSNPITPDQFRNDLPAFDNKDTWSDSSVQFWLNWAYLLLRPDRWRSVLPLGVEMWTAHNLVIEAFNNQTVEVGGLPGVNKGAIASETPGSVNVSYDTNGSSVAGASHYNLTTFGTRFKQMSNMAGMGPIQIGTPGCAPNDTFGPPWYGPPGALY